MSLRIDPCPLILSKSSRDGAIKGSVTLVNTDSRTLLFQLSFNSEDFCAISPACGELEPGATRQLTLFVESTDSDSLEFTVKFVRVAPGTTQAQITELMMREAEWTDFTTGKIRFSSHVEDVMRSVRSALGPRSHVSVDEAIQKQQASDLEEEQISLLEESLRQKQATHAELQSKVEKLNERLKTQSQLLENLQNQPDIQGGFSLIAFLVFLVALFVRFVFK